MEFKVGDKVKVTEPERLHYSYEGFVFSVAKGSTHPIEVGFSHGSQSVFKKRELELVEALPEKYEEVEVMFCDSVGWKKRKFLCFNEMSETCKYVTADKNGHVGAWEFMRRIKKPQEMTMGEICKELGREVKIKK